MSRRLPWRRTAIKFGAMFFGRRYRHYFGWWPSLSISARREDGKRTVIYRGKPAAILSPLADLARLAGSEIVVVGSGPSIKTTNCAAIPNFSAILLNGAVSLAPSKIAKPLAAAIEDERFIWRHFSMLQDHLPREVPLILAVSVIRAICDIDPAFLKERQVHLIDDLRKPYGRARASSEDLVRLPFVSLSGDGAYGFSSEPDAGVFIGHSVAVSAVQFAVACKPKSVGFAGIDLSNDAEPRFYERAGQTEPTGLSGSLGFILCHLDLARDRAAAKGIDFINYSPTSALSRIGIGYDPRLTLESG